MGVYSGGCSLEAARADRPADRLGQEHRLFLATKILRDLGSGPALLISPLLALMRNQIEAARKIGLQPFTINSENVDERHAAQAAILHNECDIPLISPERLANPDFRSAVLSRIQNSIGLFIVDEAHCIFRLGTRF